MAMNEPVASQATEGGGSARAAERVFYALVLLAAIAFAFTLHVVFFKAPVEATMGIVQKIFYFHVPAAISMYLGAAACFVGSAGYLARGTSRWDALARSGAEVAVVMGMMVLVSGPLWAAKAWGVYWTWDPRLTTSMLSVLVYVSYVVLRSFAGDGDAERKFAAALGVLGAANLPIIHYSVQKWGGNHPTVISSGGQVVIVGPTMAPPPPRVENPGAARRGYVWIEGAYAWSEQARQYEWVPGHWERAKAGHRWAPVRWELRGNVYVRVGGEWQIGG